jgi:5'(3')-deoxyribonucleotidase
VTARRRPTIAVDLDDVCADRLSVIADMLRSEGHHVLGRHPGDWDLRTWGVRSKAQYDRLHYAAFVENPGYRSMPPLPGALDALRRMREDGYQIRIVTGRLWTSQVVLPALRDTGHWLAEHNVPVDDVAFVSDKTAIDADLYIEDAPHFVTALQRAERTVIVMDTPYNRHLPGRRAGTWEEILVLIHEQLSARESRRAASPATGVGPCR